MTRRTKPRVSSADFSPCFVGDTFLTQSGMRGMLSRFQYVNACLCLISFCGSQAGAAGKRRVKRLCTGVVGVFWQSVILCFSVSTCTAICKKNPPPIPPRITSKPYIAVTVQSSTESAQDTYLDSQDPRSEVNSQSGRSNSSDSIASSRTGSLVKGVKRPPILPPIPAPREPLPLPSARVTTPPPAIVRPSPAPDTRNEPASLTVAPNEPQALPKRKLSSIGIQVCENIYDFIIMLLCYWRTYSMSGHVIVAARLHEL